jgi:hypothetical protein
VDPGGSAIEHPKFRQMFYLDCPSHTHSYVRAKHLSHICGVMLGADAQTDENKVGQSWPCSLGSRPTVGAGAATTSSCVMPPAQCTWRGGMASEAASADTATADSTRS